MLVSRDARGKKSAVLPWQNKQERAWPIASRFALWAGLALLADIVSKLWAVTALEGGGRGITKGFSLLLMFNSGAAGGVSLGPYTWQINIVGTVAALMLVSSVVVPLARVDWRSILAMGLIAGGAAGNLTSLLFDVRGVPDFLALHLGTSALVFNVADIALWAGAALLVPITAGMLQSMRLERRRVRIKVRAS